METKSAQFSEFKEIKMIEFQQYTYFIVTCLIIIFQVYECESRCNFTKENLLYEERLIVEYKNNTLNLLRQPTIDEGTILYMICHNKDDFIEMKCHNGKITSDKFTLPLKNCTKPLQAQHGIIKNETSCPYDTYSVAYNFTLKGKIHQLEIYRVCFDRNKMRTIFTTNEVYPNFIPRPKNAQFQVDDIFTPYFFSAYSNREVSTTFEQLLGKEQVYIMANDTSKRIDRGHLMAAADAMTNNMIRSTFKMINVIPQFHSVNAGNWKRLEEWVRKPFNNGSKVCSGAFNRVLSLKKANGETKWIKIYLRDDKIPIPLWTYKIVRPTNMKRIAFLQYNNIYDMKTPPTIPKEYNCQIIKCPNTLSLNNSNNYFGYTYCCEPNFFMGGRLKTLLKHC